LAIAEFVLNNKIHIVIKILLFKVNYGKELRMGFEIRKKKYVKVKEFIKEMKEMYKEVKAVLRKLQEEMKKYADRNRKEAKEYKIGDKCYNSVTLGLIKERNLVLELIQENSIENSIQDCLPYILLAHSPCSPILAYSK